MGERSTNQAVSDLLGGKGIDAPPQADLTFKKASKAAGPNHEALALDLDGLAVTSPAGKGESVVDYVAPRVLEGADGFNCPRCGAFAHQRWYPRGPRPVWHDWVVALPAAYRVAVCQRCDGLSIWEDANLIHP